MEGSIQYKKKHPKECVNCGICKSNCPIYRETLKESYSARGRMSLIKAFYENEITDTRQLSDRFYSCILCGACNKSCPLNIDLTQSICEMRGLLNKKDKKIQLMSFLIKYGFRNPKYVFKGIGFFDYIYQHMPFKNKLEKILKYYGLKITPSKTSLTDIITLSKTNHPIGRVALYPGCSINYLFPSIGISLIEILNLLNYDVVIPRQSLCCGAPQIAMGLVKEAERVATKQTEIFSSLSLDAVISLCPTCVHMMTDVYEDLFQEGVKGMIDTNRFILQQSDKIKNLCDNISSLYPNTQLIYHQPCHIKNYHDSKYEISALLRSIGLDLIYDENCCGFGGTFRFIQTEISHMLASRIKSKYNPNELIITSCPNCIIQFTNQNLNSKHFIDIINYAMKG